MQAAAYHLVLSQTNYIISSSDPKFKSSLRFSYQIQLFKPLTQLLQTNCKALQEYTN